MEENGSSIGSKAFGVKADPVPIVPFQSHQDALRFLSSALQRPNRIALLQGPAGAGKTTVVQSLVASALRDTAVAVIEGEHLRPNHLLTGLHVQYDLKIVSRHDEQLMQSLNRFVTREAREKRAPVMIVDNVDRATPSALRVLNWLAALEVGDEFAVRIILTGRARLPELLANDALRNLARRRPAAFTLNPLTPYETMTYLRARLLAAGDTRAEKVFSMDVCDRLNELSSGWPGPLNTAALSVMESVAKLASDKPVPRVVLTRDGETLAEIELTKRRYIIGRSELADIVVEDGYVSKLHAMLQIYGDAVVVIDLNSTNGTTVNSRKLLKTILRNDDVIMLGRHRLKLENAPAIKAEVAEQVGTSDTMTMQTLSDVRLARARKTIAAIKKDTAG